MGYKVSKIISVYFKSSLTARCRFYGEVLYIFISSISKMKGNFDETAWWKLIFESWDATNLKDIAIKKCGFVHYARILEIIEISSIGICINRICDQIKGLEVKVKHLPKFWLVGRINSIHSHHVTYVGKSTYVKMW